MEKAETVPAPGRGSSVRPRITDLATHDEAFVTVGQFAEYLGVHRRQVAKWIGARALTAYRFGGRWWRIQIEDARAFVKNSSNVSGQM